MRQLLKKDRSIKLKVFTSYAFIALLVGVLLYYTFNSFDKLTSSADVLAEPNPRIALLHDIFVSIYDAESHIRSYTLTSEESHLDEYFQQLALINNKVDTLYGLARKDEVFIHTIDSIHFQLLQKTILLEQFIELKSRDINSIFYKTTLNEIIDVTEEGLSPKKAGAMPEEKDEQQRLGEKVENEQAQATIDENEQRRGFFARVRDVFSRTKDEEESKAMDSQKDTQSDANIEEEEIRTDRFLLQEHFDLSSLHENIEFALLNFMKSVLEEQRKTDIEENEILIQDKEIMDQIWSHIAFLVDYESEIAAKLADDAHATVNTTSTKIFTVLFLALLVLAVFSWLFIADVNKSKFYKQQLYREKLKAEELVLVKQRFLANMSHEIRTPLHSIKGFTTQIKKTDLAPSQKEYADAIHQSSTHLIDIVNDILDFSKIEAGKIKLSLNPVNVKDLFWDVHKSLTVLAQSKGLRLYCDTTLLHHPYYMVDSVRLKQVLLNIANNAIKFTDDGSVLIKVSDFHPEDSPGKTKLFIRIKDTGIGISDEDQKLIFEEFAQLDAAESRRYGGTGLGLSISSKLVEMMGGSIDFVSSQGKGSVFSVSIPVEEAELPDQQHVEDFNNSFDFSGKLLLVDDDKMNRFLFRSFVEGKNLVLDEAATAYEARDWLNLKQYDLIVTDIQMPGISGIELTRLVRADSSNVNRETPVLACSADITSDTFLKAERAGVNDFLLKPFDEKELFEKLQPHLHIRNTKNLNHEDAALEDVDALDQISFKQSELYSLKSLETFTGSNSRSLITALESFIGDTRENLQGLEAGLAMRDKDMIYRRVHKMSNMFGLLKVEQVNILLHQLKSINTKDMNWSEIEKSISFIDSSSKNMLIQLQKDIDKIKKDYHNQHT